MYTDGEFLAVLYNEKLAAAVYSGLGCGVFQVFSIETGLLVEEVEHYYAQSSMCGCVSPAWDYLYMLQDNKGTSIIYRYKISPPLSLSAWRQERMKEEETGDGFPTTAVLREEFPLSIKNNDEANQDQALTGSEIDDLVIGDESKGSDDDHDNDDVPMVDLNAVVACILHKLDADCRHANQVNTKKIPPSLQYLFAVELCPSTFSSLLALISQLSSDYLSNKKINKDYEHVFQLRLMSFIVALNLLRVNVAHMVKWNVNPSECGFSTGSDSSASAYNNARRRRRRHRNASVSAQKASQMRREFVTLLTLLVNRKPSNPLCATLTERVTKEVKNNNCVFFYLFFTLDKILFCSFFFLFFLFFLFFIVTKSVIISPFSQSQKKKKKKKKKKK